MSKRAGSFEQSNIFLRRGIAPESSTITLLQQANKVKGDQLFDFEKLWLYQQYCSNNININIIIMARILVWADVATQCQIYKEVRFSITVCSVFYLFGWKYIFKKTASTRNIKLSLKDFKNSNMLRGLGMPPTPMWESDYDIIVSKGAHGTQCLELKEILKFQLARY